MIWFNTFSKYQLMGMYEANNEIEFAEKLVQKSKENALLLLIDIIRAGIKGDCLANNKTTPDVYDKINMVFAEMPMEETLIIWNDVFNVFNLHMGRKKEQDESKKKDDEEIPMTEQKPEPVTKMS